MPPPKYVDPEEAARRSEKIRRGLDPDFRYTAQHFVRVATFRKNGPHFIEAVGFNNVGVLLLTFRSHLRVKEARRRLNNIWRRFFREIFGHSICMVHFTEKGRVHFHLLVDCRGDIRTGFGIEEGRDYIQANRKANNIGPRVTLQQRRAMRDAIPANDLLRNIWAVGDQGIPSFGFGRVWDVFPVLENGEAITNYLVKGFLAGLPLQLRLGRNKGAQLITYSVGCPRAVPTGWRPPSTWFPTRIKALVPVFGMRDLDELKSMLKEEHGRSWAYAVMQLCAHLDNNLHPDWPFMGPAVVVPAVFRAITTDSRMEHYFNFLRDRVGQAMVRYIHPAGPPPPPASIPSKISPAFAFEPITI